MALVVETGAGLANAEAYASVAQYRARAAALGRADVLTAIDADIEVALRKGANFMLESWRLAWQGYRVSNVQALDWPRYEVPRADAISGNRSLPSYYDYNIVPTEVVNANIDLAYKSAGGLDLSPDIEPFQKMVKVGPITVEYDPGSSQATTFRSIENMLAPLLMASGSGMTMSLVRT